MGQYVFDLGNGQWDIPELRQLLTGLLDDRECIEDYRVEHDFATVGQRTMRLDARRLGQEGRNRILLAIDGITERERREKELAALTEFGDKFFDSIREGLVVMRSD